MLKWFKKSVDVASNQQLAVEPALPLDLLRSDFVADPYPTYSWLRAHCPVAEIAGGGYLLTKHADIRAALTDPKLGNAPSRFSTLSARNSEKYVAADLASHISPFLDGDAHVKTRQMTSRAFFNALKGFKGEVEALAKVQVARLISNADLVSQGSQPFALNVMCKFCGMDVDPSQMKILTQAFFHLFAPLRDPEAFVEVNESLSVFRKVIRKSLREGPPQNSLLSELQTFAKTGDEFSEDQVVDNCLLVFADGVENIEAAAASLLVTFEQFDVFSGLESDEFSLEQAIHEGLRLQTPAQLIPRVARENICLGGLEIKKDMPVFLALASGNRDALVFDEPDIFNATRDFRKSLTFGQGRHRCIGEPLAMLQLSSFMGALIEVGLRPNTLCLNYQARIGHRWPRELRLKMA